MCDTDLYEDNLKTHKSYAHISTKTRDLLIKDSTQHLSARIRDVKADLTKAAI